MPIRPAKFASVIFVGLLASAGLATIAPCTAEAAGDCLAAPRDQTPDGSHWYYRLDHAAKRQCWYLKREGEKAAQSTAAPTKPIAPMAETAAPRSLADARAELPPQTRLDPWSRDNAPNQVPPASAANVPRAENPEEANGPSSVVASRWPEQVAAAAPAATTADPVARTSTAQPPATQPLAPLTNDELAAADTSSQAPDHSLRMQLVALIGVLALLGVIARAVFRSSRARQRQRRRHMIHARREAIWQRTDNDRIAQSARRDAEVLPRRPGIPQDLDKDLDRADDPDQRFEELLPQLSRRAPN